MDFGPPPPDADKQKTPVLEELRRLALEGVANELKQPSCDEDGGGIRPEPVDKNTSHKQSQGNKNQRNPQGVAGSIDWVLMARRVLRDPLNAGAVSEHGGNDTPAGGARDKKGGPAA